MLKNVVNSGRYCGLYYHHSATLGELVDNSSLEVLIDTPTACFHSKNLNKTEVGYIIFINCICSQSSRKKNIYFLKFVRLTWWNSEARCYKFQKEIKWLGRMKSGWGERPSASGIRSALAALELKPRALKIGHVLLSISSKREIL